MNGGGCVGPSRRESHVAQHNNVAGDNNGVTLQLIPVQFVKAISSATMIHVLFILNAPFVERLIF